MSSRVTRKSSELEEGLRGHGFSRRDFMKFCTTAAATLGLSAGAGVQIAEALEKPALKPIVVWLEMQACTGDTESLLRASKPTVGELVLDIISYDYHETIMAPAGHQAEKSLKDALAFKKEKGLPMIAVIEGSIPTGEGGAYCCIGGRTALDIAREVCSVADITIAAGNCAFDGGWPAAQPNPTGAKGVGEALGISVVNLPGCPMNVENLTAVIVHFLTFGALPAVDSMGRPRFAYGKRIHDNCERRSHFDAGQFVRSWGDPGHREGWCLYYMGCKGPETFHNCPTVRWNEGTSWPVQAGHGCIGCAAPRFWDSMTPFYRRLPAPPGFGVESSADDVGGKIAAAAAIGLGAHFGARALKKASQGGSCCPSDKDKEE